MLSSSACSGRLFSGWLLLYGFGGPSRGCAWNLSRPGLIQDGSGVITRSQVARSTTCAPRDLSFVEYPVTMAPTRFSFTAAPRDCRRVLPFQLS